MLLPHIEALASHSPPDTDTDITAYVLNQAGLFLEGQGQPGRATGYFQRVLADCERALGADHPDTLTSRNNLADAYQAAGLAAIPLYERTLADPERVLGADHPDTLTSRNNLAAPTGRRAGWARRSRCTSGPWPTASGCWAPTTPTR